MFKWLMRIWHRRQRAIDTQILWPCLRANAKSIDQARAAFILHIMADPAWADQDPDDVIAFVKRLP
jgi:hypothetical protein